MQATSSSGQKQGVSLISAKNILAIVLIILMFGGKWLPSMFGLSDTGMQVLGIFVATIGLWLFVSTNWPSILSIVALTFTPFFDYQTVLAGSMGAWITSFVLFSAMLSYVLGQSGFLKRISVWFITRPATKKNPWLFLGYFFLVPLVIGAFMSPITAFMVTVPIAESIFKELGYVKGDRLPQMIVLGLLGFSSVSTLTTPIAHSVTILGLSLYQKDFNRAIGFVPYSIFGIVTAIFIFIITMLIFRFVFKPDLSKLANVKTDAMVKELPAVSTRERIIVAVFAGVVILWLAPGLIEPFLPKVAAAITAMGTPIPPMLGIVVLALVKVDGKPLMDFKDAVAHGVPWGAIFMVASTMVLGSALTNPKAGITTLLVKALSPLLSGFTPLIFVTIVMLVLTVVHIFASNTVTITLMYSVVMPIVASGAISGVNAAALTCCIAAGGCIGMATPPSTATAAIAVGTEWLHTDLLLRYGTLICFVAALLISWIGYPIAAALL
ncbi:SLC13 family permease [Lacticaseibacillus baoqingensis]|uniref:SLC13 family permease n=1 Tax=Lacticaseibacillus baoqingensis TaxID=2486013 RepID=A0ABW4E888_9LACO|nr:SLC13 family permease [Lacticaseibacillus baoqingensis]